MEIILQGSELDSEQREKFYSQFTAEENKRTKEQREWDRVFGPKVKKVVNRLVKK